MSTIVFGPSQSGKTAGIAIPAILEANGPVVAVSVKRDLLEHTLPTRQQLGNVAVYDPTGAAGCPPRIVVGWDPIAALRRLGRSPTSGRRPWNCHCPSDERRGRVLVQDGR